MSHSKLTAATVVLLLFAGAPFALAAEGPAREPLTKPGDTFVSLQIEGCSNRCPSFEIVVFDTGRMTFRPNNSYTSENKIIYKNGMRNIYERIAKYLQDSDAFSPPAECTGASPDPTVVTVQSVKDTQTQKASWSSGCANQVEKARALGKVFVNESGTWSLINSDSRYWEKYWETWKYPEK
jgi:hypothetical protein